MSKSARPKSLTRQGKLFDILHKGVERLILLDPTTLPESLYHYTDAAGVSGILNSGTVWATHFCYMNDFSEITYGIDLAKNVWESIKDEFNPPIAAVGNAAITSVLEAIDDAPKPASPHVFLVCFSERGDLLNQWRSYAENAAGYSIGLSAAQLFQSFLRDDGSGTPRPILRQVEYDPARQRDAITRLLRTMLHNYSEHAQEIDEAVHSVIGYALLSVCQTFKDPSFSDEREWRLIQTIFDAELTQRGVRTRISRGQIVPYLPIQIGRDGERLPISRIYRGPRHASRYSPNRAFGEVGLYYMLREKGYENIDTLVKESTVPYR